MNIYLDYNASAPIDKRVLESMNNTYQVYYGNADSRTHDFGGNVLNQVNHARKKVARLIGVNNDEVFFTSGSTESNNIAILGLREFGLSSGKKHIITTSIEHKAVIESAKHLKNAGFEVDFIAPQKNGRICVSDVLERVREDTLLVSVMHVNNETGIIQPVDEIGIELEKKGVLFHVDATQSCGKLVMEIRNLKYNMLSVSAHKMYGPQGIAALILKKKNYRLPPVKSIMYGGPQEYGIRPGTLPTALIVGFGQACEIAENEYIGNNVRCIEIKKRILNMIDNSGVKYAINGDQNFAITNTLNVSFLGVSSEALMLVTKQFCAISNGSACNSSNYKPSQVLTAMKLTDERIESAVRISWGADTNIVLLEKNMKQLLNAVKQFI